jgi:hypothetical protein
VRFGDPRRRRRIGLVRPPCLPNGGHMIHIDVQPWRSSPATERGYV